MCGIAGFCLNKDEHINARKVSMALLNQIVSRGEDATGAAWVQSNKETKKATIAVSKAPVAARNFDPYLGSMPKTTRRAILHTRWATKGTPENNLNNHPIVSGRVVGVHNGVLRNDDAIFRHVRSANRRGQVDSEAAFALLDRSAVSGYAPIEVLESVEGRAALAWFDARDKRDLHLARVMESPLAIGQTVHGSLVFASTMPLLLKGCDIAGLDMKWLENVDEMTYLKIRRGEILELESIGQSVKEIAS